jgi:hypothetical protein
LFKETVDATVEAESRLYVVNNRPSDVFIPRSEFAGFEDLVAINDANYQKGLSMAMVCNRIHNRLSAFGEFMCTRSGELAQLMGRHKQLRVKFRDQDGVERFVTWERRPVGLSCDVSYENFTCRVPDNSRFWEEWLHGDGQEDLVRRVFEDPTYDPSTLVVFENLRGFLPRAEGALPLRSVVTAQTRDLKVVGQRQKQNGEAPRAAASPMTMSATTASP